MNAGLIPSSEHTDLLASELIVRGRLGAPDGPEKRLVEAVLFAAADDLRKYDPGSIKHNDAAAWIAHTNHDFDFTNLSGETFVQIGFGYACAILGLDPQATAAAMLRGLGLPLKEHKRFNVMAPVKERARTRVRELREARRLNGR